MHRTTYQQLVKEVLEIRRIVNMPQPEQAIMRPVVLRCLANIVHAARELAGLPALESK